MMPQKILFSEKEVYEITGIPVTTLRKKRWEGGFLPFVKIGRRVYYNPEDVYALKENAFLSTSQYKRGE